MRTPKEFQSGKALGWIIFIIVVVVAVILFARSDQFGTIDTADAYTITISNVSTDQPLSPGVYVVHTEEASLDFAGTLSPAELEPLAEYGSHADFATFVAAVPGVIEVITIDTPILPGESTSFDVTIEEGQEGLLLSGIQMAVGSNDGYALVSAVPITATTSPVPAMNYDNGTEENSELGSGFEGGQPDPARGEENIDNGTPTDPHIPVAIHDQLTETILEVSLVEIENKKTSEDEAMDNGEVMGTTADSTETVTEEDGGEVSSEMPADPNNPVDEMIVNVGGASQDEVAPDDVMEEAPTE